MRTSSHHPPHSRRNWVALPPELRGSRPNPLTYLWYSLSGDSQIRDFVEEIFELADIRINDSRPWDIHIRDERFFRRVVLHGSLGIGESYMDGWWDVERLDQFFERVLINDLSENAAQDGRALLLHLQTHLLNMQSQSRAGEIGERHYDIGNDLYEAMLDRGMNYSCAYWKEAESLEQAQENKLELICRKLQLRPGMKTLDIGCGWGGFARYAAERYGVSVTGVTVSREQVTWARERCAGLPVEILYQDYRNAHGSYDRIVSIGMFEHVGYKNYSAFMNTARRLLKEDGLFLLHTIGGNRSRTTTDPWIARYIFPNSMLPSARQIAEAAENVFVMEDWHNFGADYDKTLMTWFERFNTAWPNLKSRYGERFYRMWKYYLLACAGCFRARKNQLWQIVYSPRGVSGGYLAPR